uniref:Uncharacterized protein n=1 Tax=Anguilla anguilla TaxID=7936 RepID=A0A0E9PDC1_ANGAN
MSCAFCTDWQKSSPDLVSKAYIGS